MDRWEHSEAGEWIHEFDLLNTKQQTHLLEYLNRHFPPSVYQRQRQQKRQAQLNIDHSRDILKNTRLHFPPVCTHDTIEPAIERLARCAILLTAGGEGERLRASLLKRGTVPEQLIDFTKATYPLPGFERRLGTLQINLLHIASLCRQLGIDIPVIVTTGPPGSITARVIPDIVAQTGNFGLKNITIIPQNRRLHLSQDDRIVYTIENGSPRPITNPDETGGPLMRVKEPIARGKPTALAWLERCGCNKVIVLQATALYSPRLIATMAHAAADSDCVGVGIFRDRFAEDDPFGTYIQIERDGERPVIIVEKEARVDAVYSIKDPSGAFFLPRNTGLYVFDLNLMAHNDLPDYASPPKEIAAGMRAPKIGYAATDYIAFARTPVIHAIEPDMYHVLKNIDDLSSLSSLAKRYGLYENSSSY
jgi:hypothetical protein